MEILKHQKYRHKKFVHVTLTVLRQHVILKSHWNVRQGIDGDYFQDALVEAQDVTDSWELIYTPEKTEVNTTL